MKTSITPLENDQIQTLAAFAEPIWFEHYTPIIGEQQVKYMLDKFQSEQAITSQIEEGYQYFLVKNDNQLLGYFALQFRENDSLFISKFYLSSSARGKGIGKVMLDHITQLAKQAGSKTLDLTVNKYNSAYQIYLKLGFINQGSAEFDIGNGYIMDDYLMSKVVLSIC